MYVNKFPITRVFHIFYEIENWESAYVSAAQRAIIQCTHDCCVVSSRAAEFQR